MPAHRFTLGQDVEVLQSTQRSAAGGHYRITALLPLESDGPKYRLKSIDEKHERVLAERDLLAIAEMPTP